jgi:uncharacterized membrane protein YcaP (DUF421 family)
MEHLIGGISQLGWVAAKALLLYLTAVVGFRLCKRRTLADLSPFDFVAVVAVGAIIGRVPNATDASYLAGVATLVTVLAAHAVITRLRQFPSIARLIEHSPRVLVSDGHVLEQELRRCGLTRGDLNALLRQEGVQELSEVKYLIFEQRGRVSLVPAGRAQARRCGAQCPHPRDHVCATARHSAHRTQLRPGTAPWQPTERLALRAELHQCAACAHLGLAEFVDPSASAGDECVPPPRCARVQDEWRIPQSHCRMAAAARAYSRDRDPIL